jgi:hypothetical protein
MRISGFLTGLSMKPRQEAIGLDVSGIQKSAAGKSRPKSQGRDDEALLKQAERERASIPRLSESRSTDCVQIDDDTHEEDRPNLGCPR